MKPKPKPPLCEDDEEDSFDDLDVDGGFHPVEEEPIEDEDEDVDDPTDGEE